MLREAVVPRITDLATAIKVYYENIELGSAEIRELFGDISNGKVTNLKNAVLKVMSERGIVHFGYRTVNTQVAYEVWGLKIEDLERRFKALQKLNI